MSIAGLGIGRESTLEPSEALPRFRVQEKQAQLQFNVGELEKALYARVIKKCGNRS